jgi:hypothetical protein
LLVSAPAMGRLRVERTGMNQLAPYGRSRGPRQRVTEAPCVARLRLTRGCLRRPARRAWRRVAGGARFRRDHLELVQARGSREASRLKLPKSMPVAENVLSARDHVQHLLASPRGAGIEARPPLGALLTSVRAGSCVDVALVHSQHVLTRGLKLLEGRVLVEEGHQRTIRTAVGTDEPSADSSCDENDQSFTRDHVRMLRRDPAARGIARKRPAGGWRQVAKNFRTLTHSSATARGPP